MSKLTKLIGMLGTFFAVAITKRTGSTLAAEIAPQAGLPRVQTTQSISDNIAGRTVPGYAILPRALGRKISTCHAPETQAVLGWGQKPSGEQARMIAEAHGLKLIRGEDGLIRSIRRTGPALSLILDEYGIHYDPACPSIIDAKLEQYRDNPLKGARLTRIRKIKNAMIADGVSKYNQSRDPETMPDRPYVLVLDQTKDDCSVLASGGNTHDFIRMLAQARTDYPGHLVVVRTHPDQAIGKTGGYFRPEHIAAHTNIVLDKGNSHLARLLDDADHVYVYSSQAGFEALLRGKPVSCFGTPFFAYRGLTRDYGPEPAYGRQQCSIDTLAYATLIDAIFYWHPETGAPCEVETVIEHIARYRRAIASDPARAVPCGFSRRKMPVLKRFFPATEFVTNPKIIAADPNLPVVAWGKAWDTRKPGKAVVLPERPACVIRVEDGFTRSRGLGSAFVAPISWILDPFGVHFDRMMPSVLEKTLLEHDFTAEDRERAQGYRARLLELGISKYNLGKGESWTRPQAEGRHVILVPGQVESDMSILYGAPKVKTNRALLEAVRKRNPDAYILYRPHPDVLGGYRPGDPAADSAGIADEVDCSADIHDVLGKVDAVEVITSLTGMEALLHRLPVICHGVPFFAGWGLTTDLVPCPKRNRRLTLDELVYGAYIASPRFIGPASRELISAEQALDALAAMPEGMPNLPRGMIARIVGNWMSRRRQKMSLAGQRPANDSASVAGDIKEPASEGGEKPERQQAA